MNQGTWNPAKQSQDSFYLVASLCLDDQFEQKRGNQILTATDIKIHKEDNARTDT